MTIWTPDTAPGTVFTKPIDPVTPYSPEGPLDDIFGVNPGFEYGDLTGYDLDNHKASVVTTRAYRGDYSCLIQGSSSGFGGGHGFPCGTYDNGYIKRTFAAEVGKACRFGFVFWMTHTWEEASPSSMSATVYIDPGTGVLEFVDFVGGSENTGKWVSYHHDFRSQGSSLEMRILVFGPLGENGNTSAYFDDLIMLSGVDDWTDMPSPSTIWG